MTQQFEDEPEFSASLDHIKGFLAVLTSVKQSKRQARHFRPLMRVPAPPTSNPARPARHAGGGRPGAADIHVRRLQVAAGLCKAETGGALPPVACRVAQLTRSLALPRLLVYASGRLVPQVVRAISVLTGRQCGSVQCLGRRCAAAAALA
jgi:hypothetical protein